ncbi:MAG TPA: hypothetical protein VFH21_06985 [Burkholderiales bacterium]|jgi:hypothetical protein|nr:hypothetical protein [Burkholderiales bacterium]
MLTLTDCLDLSELSSDLVHEIAKHEHVPEIVAIELGHLLLKSSEGVNMIRSYLLDNLKKASAQGHRARAKKLDRMIAVFNAAHSPATSPHR